MALTAQQLAWLQTVLARGGGGPFIDIGTDPGLQQAAQTAASGIDLTPPAAPPIPRRSVTSAQARAESRPYIDEFRADQGMTGPEVQAGHVEAIRHVAESGAPAD